MYQILLGIFVALTALPSTVSSKLICDAIYARQARIQGFAFLPNHNKSLIFINDYVYEFELGEGDAPFVKIKTAGIYVPSYLDGVYIKDGATIKYVYSTHNITTRIVFVMTHEKAYIMSPNAEEYLEKINGFQYVVDTDRSTELQNARVPFDFPFLFLSDALDRIYIQQVNQYAFIPINVHNQAEGYSRPNLLYYGFNSLERTMMRSEAYLGKHSDVMNRQFEFQKSKLLLHAGFGYRGLFYFVSNEHVFVVEQKSLEGDSLNDYVLKMPMDEFFKCTPEALLFATDYGRIFTIILFIILMFAVIYLFFHVCWPNLSDMLYRLFKRKSDRKYKRRKTRRSRRSPKKSGAKKKRSRKSSIEPNKSLSIRRERSHFYPPPDVLKRRFTTPDGTPITIVRSPNSSASSLGQPISPSTLGRDLKNSLPNPSAVGPIRSPSKFVFNVQNLKSDDLKRTSNLSDIQPRRLDSDTSRAESFFSKIEFVPSQSDKTERKVDQKKSEKVIFPSLVVSDVPPQPLKTVQPVLKVEPKIESTAEKISSKVQKNPLDVQKVPSNFQKVPSNVPKDPSNVQKVSSNVEKVPSTLLKTDELKLNSDFVKSEIPSINIEPVNSGRKNK